MYSFPPLLGVYVFLCSLVFLSKDMAEESKEAASFVPPVLVFVYTCVDWLRRVLWSACGCIGTAPWHVRWCLWSLHVCALTEWLPGVVTPPHLALGYKPSSVIRMIGRLNEYWIDSACINLCSFSNTWISSFLSAFTFCENALLFRITGQVSWQSC